jgi:hypothetical protein
MKGTAQTTTKDRLLDQLKVWFTELRFAEWAQVVDGDQDHMAYDLEEDDGVTILVQIDTAVNEYRITASPTYLGCIACSPQPDGAKPSRDLADGAFCKRTWNRIIAEIVGYELMTHHLNLLEHCKAQELDKNCELVATVDGHPLLPLLRVSPL